MKTNMQKRPRWDERLMFNTTGWTRTAKCFCADVSHLLESWQKSILMILIIILNLTALVSVISSLCCTQVDHRRVGALSQILRQPGLSDPHCSLRAGPPRRNQPLGPQQVLQRREAREPEALQPSVLSCPVEDGGVVRGWASTPESGCWWSNFWMGPKKMTKVKESCPISEDL